MPLSRKFILFGQVFLPILSLHFSPVRCMLNAQPPVWLSTLIVFIIKGFTRRSKFYIIKSLNVTPPFNLSSVIQTCADPGGRAVWGVGLQPLDCWTRGSESRWGHECWSLVFVVCCVGNVIWDEPITRSGESYWECVSVCGLGTSQRGGLGQIWGTAPEKKKPICSHKCYNKPGNMQIWN